LQRFVVSSVVLGSSGSGGLGDGLLAGWRFANGFSVRAGWRFATGFSV